VLMKHDGSVDWTKAIMPPPDRPGNLDADRWRLPNNCANRYRSRTSIRVMDVRMRLHALRRH